MLVYWVMIPKPMVLCYISIVIHAYNLEFSNKAGNEFS